MDLSLQVETLWLCKTVLTFLSLLTFSSSDISPGDWERPISVTDLFWTLGLGLLGVADKSVNPFPDSVINLKTFLCGPGFFSPLMKITFLSPLSDTHQYLQKAVVSNHPEIIQVSFKAVWNRVYLLCFLFFFQLSFVCVLSVVVDRSSWLCTLNKNSIFWLLLTDVISLYLRLVQVRRNSKSVVDDEAWHVSFIAWVSSDSQANTLQRKNPNHNFIIITSMSSVFKQLGGISAHQEYRYVCLRIRYKSCVVNSW